MKIVALAAGTLLLANVASACSVVEVLSQAPSFRNVRIVTLYDGSPLKNVDLKISSDDGRRRLSLSTNKHGVARFSLSPPGRYHIAANAPDGLDADLILNVSESGGGKESSFTLILMLRPPPPPSFGDKIAAAESGPALRVPQFDGIVTDPLGAVIARTKIEVFKSGSRGSVRLAQTESDAVGHFLAAFPVGTYTAVFMAPGFRTYFLVFEIGGDVGREQVKNLKIPLQIAGCGSTEG